MTFFGSALGSSRRHPTPSPAMLWTKKTVISTHLIKIQLCAGGGGGGGGGGGVATFTNNNENVPTLLTLH